MRMGGGVVFVKGEGRVNWGGGGSVGGREGESEVVVEVIVEGDEGRCQNFQLGVWWVLEGSDLLKGKNKLLNALQSS